MNENRLTKIMRYDGEDEWGREVFAMRRQLKHNLSGECSAHDLASANNEQLRLFGATLQCLHCGGHNGTSYNIRK